MESFRKFSVCADSAEDDLFDLHNHGALGTEILDHRSFICFFPDDDALVDNAVRYCGSRGWTVSEIERCAGQNWVQACEDVWIPISVGKLKIHPLLNEQSRQQIEPDTIYIVPGEGFGTGHHPSTRLAMQMIQYIESSPGAKIRSALDFGTGNGILAIATGMAFPSAVIDAIDNDPSAIPNAAENLALNLMSERVTLSVNSIEALVKRYDLITANIYAEVLCSYESQMAAALQSNGYLILAGIMESRAHLIRDTFTDSGWLLIRHLVENGWESFLFQRKA